MSFPAWINENSVEWTVEGAVWIVADTNALFLKAHYFGFSPAVIIFSDWMGGSEERGKIAGKEWCVYKRERPWEKQGGPSSRIMGNKTIILCCFCFICIIGNLKHWDFHTQLPAFLSFYTTLLAGFFYCLPLIIDCVHGTMLVSVSVCIWASS